MKSIGKFIITVASILFFGWILISYLDIIADNLHPNPDNYDWNFFTILSEYTHYVTK